MATSLNQARHNKVHTHEGAPVIKVGAHEELTRTVCSCLLFEKTFYESGQSVADRIRGLVPRCDPLFVADTAIRARNEMKLRHVPLLLARELAREPKSRNLLVSLLPNIINRADELAEFMAIYWSEGRSPVAYAVRRGLGAAFNKFDEYQFAKYNRDKDIKLRDVLRVVHPVPKDDAQSAIFKKLKEGTLATPDTWEVALSACSDKSAEWTRLLKEHKLGAMALLRNLRNMGEANVDRALVREELANARTDKILPFRFISAADHNPHLEDVLETMMLKNLEGIKKLPGKTVLLSDVSWSMDDKLSAKSTMKRDDAASGIAVITRELCEEVEIYAFGNNIYAVPNRRGFALRERLKAKQEGTKLGQAVEYIQKNVPCDRIIVFTDEQTQDRIPNAAKGVKGYIVNVAANQNGVGYDGGWVHVHGWSESVMRYISEYEDLGSKDA